MPERGHAISKAARRRSVLHLIDARVSAGASGDAGDKARKASTLIRAWRLNIGGRLYHGADALHMLAMLGSLKTDWRNRLNARLFRHKALARLCYPFMKAGRSLALAVKNVPRLKTLKRKNSENVGHRASCPEYYAFRRSGEKTYLHGIFTKSHSSLHSAFAVFRFCLVPIRACRLLWHHYCLSNACLFSARATLECYTAYLHRFWISAQWRARRL